MLKSLARGVKDGALAMAVKSYANDRLSQYGEILDVAIDTAASRITARALLKGERDPLTATVEKYAIEAEGEDRYLKLTEFTTSRPWITLLLNKLLAGKRFKLPGAVSKLL